MLDFPYLLEAESPQDSADIEHLLDRAFGPGRRAKTSYRLREGAKPVPGLSLVARDAGTLIGTIRFWPICIGGATDALLLGPLAVTPAVRGLGFGRALMAHGLYHAKRQGHRLVLLVGDASYYGKAGFSVVPAGRLEMPGPWDPDRLLYQELQPGSFAGASGMMAPGRCGS